MSESVRDELKPGVQTWCGHKLTYPTTGHRLIYLSTVLILFNCRETGCDFFTLQ